MVGLTSLSTSSIFIVNHFSNLEVASILRHFDKLCDRSLATVLTNRIGEPDLNGSGMGIKTFSESHSADSVT